MSKHQVNNAVDSVDDAMKKLRESMKGLQIRTAGFKKDHDELARAVANYTVSMLDVRAWKP